MFKCDKCGASMPQDCTCGSERPVQTEGVRYEVAGGTIWRREPGKITIGVADVSIDESEHGAAAELVRRANLLPTVEAQLAEAVELRRLAYDTASPVLGGPNARDLARLRERAEAFIAKVEAP